MVEPGEPPPFEDVNKAVVDEWTDDTTPYERVREIASRTYTPTDAAKIADRARTSPKTARKHLNVLAEEGFITTEPGDYGATLYRRSPESLVLEQATNILSRASTNELRERIEEMRDQLSTFRAEYGVDSPTELTVVRTNDVLDETEEAADIDSETIREWETTRRNLAFANAALSIANARDFVRDDAGLPDEWG
jgi:predicted ArsR family transcriptional regulator